MTKIFSAAVLAVTVTLAGCATAPNTLLTQIGKDYGFNYTKEQVRAGEKAQRFEVRAGDCSREYGEIADCLNDRERVEQTVKDERYRIYPGQSGWISWSTFIPQDYVASERVTTTIGQIHQVGGVNSTAGGLPSRPPILQLDTVGGIFGSTHHQLSGTIENGFDWGEFTPLMPVSKMRGKWTDFMLYFDSSVTSGVLQIYMDGKLVQTINKPITIEPRGFYHFKYGIYRSFVSRNKGPMPTQVVFYDELRFGKTRADVDPKINDKLLPVD